MLHRSYFMLRFAILNYQPLKSNVRSLYRAKETRLSLRPDGTDHYAKVVNSDRRRI